MDAAARLGLGTAQFGLAYGVTNRAGQVSREAVASLLDTARAAGVTLLDTAAGYGEAETVLGDVGAAGLGFRIVTKIAGPPSGFAAAARASAQALGAVPGAILLHNPAILQRPEGKDAVRALMELREQGLTGAVGVSVYGPEMLEATLGLFVPDLVQLPYNLLDRRFETTGWLDRLGRLGVERHARSLFLQGVLLAPETPPRLAFAAERLAAVRAAIAKAGMTPLEACLAVGLAAPLERLIIGVTGARELGEILAVLGRRLAAPPGLAVLATDDLALIDPSRWPRA
jgi:aryl-alcohol dehydrogenase-like predicted oxidoreductase